MSGRIAYTHRALNNIPSGIGVVPEILPMRSTDRDK